MRKLFFFLFLIVILLVACTNDSFKTGDSEYSYMQSDFVEATTNTNAAFVSAVTDDGDTLLLHSALSAKWATKADTTYRAQLYYNRNNLEVVPIAISKVYVLPVSQQPHTTNTPDPMGFTSAWIAKTRKYINLELALKTGKNTENKQSLGVSLENVASSVSGTNKYTLRLLHQQNNVPQYYTVRTFVSIPTTFAHKGDSIEVHINTYKGEVIKAFIL